MSWSTPLSPPATRCRYRGPRGTGELPNRIARRVEIHRWVRHRCETVAKRLPQGPAPETCRAICVASLASFLHPTRDGRTHGTTPRTGIELRRPPAARLPGRGGVGLPLHAEQRRAGGAERDRHLVHRPVVPRGYVRDRRSVLAHPGLRPVVWRCRFIGANIGGASLRRPPLYPRIAGHVDRPMGVAAHRAFVRIACPDGLVDFRAVRDS